MERKNAECIKLKKELKDMWAREQKKLSECKAALKAAKNKYTLLGQELGRVSHIIISLILHTHWYLFISIYMFVLYVFKMFMLVDSAK